MNCRYCKALLDNSVYISRFKCKICSMCMWAEESYYKEGLPKWVWDKIKDEPHD